MNGKTLSVLIECSGTNRSILTLASLIFPPYLCVMIYPTALGIENSFSQHFEIYHQAVLSYCYRSTEISLIVYIVSHGISVRRLQAFARAKTAESKSNNGFFKRIALLQAFNNESLQSPPAVQLEIYCFYGSRIS